MEELSLDQIKKKSELEEDIDFENGDISIFTCSVVQYKKDLYSFQHLNVVFYLHRFT